jgi:hypothetical protein
VGMAYARRHAGIRRRITLIDTAPTIAATTTEATAQNKPVSRGLKTAELAVPMLRSGGRLGNAPSVAVCRSWTRRGGVVRSVKVTKDL